ncbi:MAG: SpoIID/LytB domain-containing protein [Cyanobacteria bacterium SIG29]|nr:SpoIID/LytB domain-containing protein [Cyanobacteria bacterium SIG29]
MCKKFIYILISIFMLILPVQAQDSIIPVRVGISDTSFKTYLFDSISFNNANSLDVLDISSGYSAVISEKAQKLKVTSENNLFRLYIDGILVAKNLTGPIVIKSRNENFIEINGLKRKGLQAAYRGVIEIVRSAKDESKFSIVNILSLQNYLRGVVPNEMPVRFGLEALKAQTVAARNYAVTPRIKAYKEFDLCDSVACQVYFGANTEDVLSDEAIVQTNGIVALDDEDSPILALYSSTAGGYTESYEYAFSDPQTKVFPSKNIHYLNAVPDNKEFKNLDVEENAQLFYTSSPEAFDDNSPYYRWSKEWTVDELEKVLAKTLVAQSKTGFVQPVLENSSDFGKLISITALKRGKSGKIIELEVKTNKNTFIVQKELVIRRCFQKNNISLPSANFVISYIDAEIPVYKFSGGGFGHGVGLSQWGAGKMASLGFTYDRILQHYYKGIKLATIPFKIFADYKTVEKQFNCNFKDVYLVVKNPYDLDRLYVVINGKEHIIKLKKERVITDISKYLNEGENKITFTIADDKAKAEDFVDAFILVKDSEACDE